MFDERIFNKKRDLEHLQQSFKTKIDDILAELLIIRSKERADLHALQTKIIELNKLNEQMNCLYAVIDDLNRLEMIYGKN
jgi:uncharacterized membrane protein YgaE (UPF0421/DUF939 family)